MSYVKCQDFDQLLMKTYPLSALLVAYLLWILPPFLGAQEPSKEIKEALEIRTKATDLSMQGNLLDAIKTRASIDSVLLDSLPALKAEVLAESGMDYHWLGEYDMAIPYLKEALLIKETLPSPDIEIADLNKSIGGSYMLGGNIEVAINYLKKAISILGVESTPTNYLYLGTAHNNLANAYEQLKDIQSAILYQNRAIDIFKQYPETPAIYLIQVYLNVARMYQAVPDQEQAEFYMQKATQLTEALGSTKGVLRRMSFLELGNFHARSGNYDQAKKYAQRSLEIHIEDFGPDHPEIAVNYNNLGYIHILSEDYEEAIPYLQSALNVYQKVYGDQNHYETARTYVNLGIAHRKSGAYIEAIEAYQQAQQQLNYDREAPEAWGEVSALDLLIWTFEDLGKTYFRWYQDSNSQEHLLAADQYFTQAIQAITALRKNMTEGASKQLLYSQKYSTFEQAIHTKYEMAQRAPADEVEKIYAEIYEIMERGKGLFLLESFRNANAQQISGIPEAFIQREQALKREMDYYRKKYLQPVPIKKQSLPDTLSQFYLDQYLQTKLAYEELMQSVENDYEQYFQLTYKTTPVTLTDTQERLTDNQSLIEYMIGDSALFVAIISNGGIDIQKISLDFPLANWVEEVRQGILAQSPQFSDTDSLKKSLVKGYEDRAFQLYQILLAPVLENTPPGTQLLIIPDGVLGYLPFEALLTQPLTASENYASASFVAKDYIFSYAPSATLWLEMLTKKINPQLGIAAFAPSFPKPPYQQQVLAQLKSVKGVRDSLYELTYSLDEVHEIGQLWQAEVFTDSAASLQNFLRIAEQYRILHLSTHGKADDRVGDFCFLAFTQLTDSTLENLLFVRDLYTLRFNAEMVVLSACETGKGELQRGEGILSLARGFSYAGAKSVISTLWEVNERSTKDIMVMFYENLKKGMAKDEALQAAKIAYLEGPNEDAPFYWAAFTASGDMAPIQGEGWPWGVYAIGIVGLFAVWGGWRIRRKRKG